MALQVIRTGVGERELVEAIVPVASTDRRIALGDDRAPGQWQVPDSSSTAGDLVTLRLMIGEGHLDPVAGDYRVWSKSTTLDGQVFVTPAPLIVRVITTGGEPLEPAAHFIRIPDGGVDGQLLGLVDGDIVWVDPPVVTSPNRIYGAGVFGAGVYSPAA